MITTLKKFDFRKNIVYVGVVLIFIFFSIFLSSKGFTSGSNLLNILRQSSIIVVMAMAMTFVIGAAEIDLSVGSIAGLSSVCTAMAIANYGIIPGVLAGLAVGIMCGFVNGFLVAFARIPSFLVTLAMMGVAVGIAQWITASAPQPILNQSYNFIFGGGDIGEFPVLIIWALVFLVFGVLVLSRTRFGKYTLAVGANPIAANYSGIKVPRIRFAVMMASSVCAAIAGMLYAGRLQSGRYQWGNGDEMNVIAAVILGGTALSGGRGSAAGAAAGAVLMAMINNGLVLAGLSSPQQQVVRGIIIVLAVVLAKRSDD
ncbi:ABC transporter permease [Changpingibacter yushuensis]|uniref:ABC transporter permease n=1 Tax=Changpingibacter yushuensis TaxID=2758440 RepID=UPI0015F42D35|nr:ABC transporter permease [Changpingibacter yushuensis]